MKKLIFIFILLLIIISCSEEKGTYIMIYKVYYSAEHVVTDTLKSNSAFIYDSDKGTNYIFEDNHFLLKTTAPIEIIENTFIPDNSSENK